MKRIIIILITVVYSSTIFSQSIKDSTDFASALANNPVELLRGQISGVRVSETDGNPFGAMNVNVRGINSIRSDNQPLWIIDGVPVSLDVNHNLDAFWQYGEQSYTAALNPLSILNPSEIESIEVLKNSSATALYGARGANGVLIVRTKKGADRDRVIDWSSNLRLNTDNIGSKPSLGHNHRLAVRGSSQKGANGYNISATFRQNNLTTGNADSDNLSLKMNYYTTAHKFIHFGFDAIAGIGNISSTTGTSYLGAPSYMLALRDPSLSKDVSADDWIADYDDDTSEYRLLSSAWVEFVTSKHLTFKIDGAVDFLSNDRAIWYGKRTDFGAVTEENVGGGAAALIESMLLGYNASARADYDTYFASDHHLHASAIFELYGNSQRFNTLNGRNFSVHTMRAKGLASKGTAAQNHLFTPKYFHVGGAAYIKYDWKAIAGVELSYRLDNTPVYGKMSIRHYPAIDGYFDFHKLLLPSYDIVSAIRLSAGWGISGKEQYVPYEQFETYLSSGWPVPAPWTEFFYDGLSVLTTGEYHITADLGFFSNRLTAAFTYYDRATDDMFVMYGSAGNPVENGNKIYYQNVDPYKMMKRASIVTNRGFELDVNALCLKNNSLEWRVSAGGAYNVNQVVYADSGDFTGRAVGRNIYCTCNSLGLPVSSLYGYNSDSDGNYLDVTGEGVISEADKTILGNSIPKYTAYLGTTLRYKGLMFNLQLDGAAGFQIANINNLVKDGKTDTSGLMALSSKYVEDGDFIRIGQIGIGWTIPNRIKWLSEITVQASARNLLTLSKYSGWNPDVNSFGINALSSGLDYGSYPIQRTIVMGVSVKF